MEPQHDTEPQREDRDDGTGDGPRFPEAVGDILRRKRESYEQELATVAQQLHIRLSYLRAVEDGRFKDLPGMTYAAGFVRSYGDYLGLDGEELVRMFREQIAGTSRQVRLSVPTVASEGRIPGGAVLLISGILALAAYGVWYYLADRHQTFRDIVPEVPSQLRAILGKEVPTNVAAVPPVIKPQGAAPTSESRETGAGGTRSPTSPPPEPGVASSPVPLPGTPPAGPATPAQPTVASAVSAPTAPPAPPPPEATTVLVETGDLPPLPEEFNALLAAERTAEDGAGNPPGPPPAQVVLATPGARVTLVARMDSWVQINDKTGKSYYAAVLRAGQAVEVPNQPGLLLTAGNAGGLDILVDGEQLPSLGAVGLVKRDVPLDPAGLKSAGTGTH